MVTPNIGRCIQSRGRESGHTGDSSASGVTYFHHNLAVRQVGSVPGRDPGWRWGGARIQGQTRW